MIYREIDLNRGNNSDLSTMRNRNKRLALPKLRLSGSSKIHRKGEKRELPYKKQSSKERHYMNNSK